MRQVVPWPCHVGVMLMMLLARPCLTSPLSHYDGEQRSDSNDDTLLDMTDLDSRGGQRRQHEEPIQDSVLTSLLMLGIDNIDKQYNTKANNPTASDLLMTPNKVTSVSQKDLSDTVPVESVSESESTSVGTLADFMDPKMLLHLDNLTNLSDLIGNDETDRLQLLQYLDSVRRDAWGQFKLTALNYLQFLEQEYEHREITGRLPLDLIKTVLEMSDKVHIFHELEKDINPGLRNYLKDKLYSIIANIPGMTKGESYLPFDMGSLLRDTAWRTMRQFIKHVLWVVRDSVTKDDLERYRVELQKRTPLVALGWDLLMGDYPFPRPEGGRSFFTRQGYTGGYSDGLFGGWNQRKDYGNGGHSGGYGGYGSSSGVGYGGYGSHDGYGTSGYGHDYGIYLDPYLVLAGLGAAALLGLLGYKIILSKSVSPGKRSIDDDLAFSDLTELTHYIYSSLELADTMFGSLEPMNELRDVVNGLNSVWQEYTSDSGCVRCSLVDFAANHTVTDQDHIKNFALIGLANLLGSAKSGQLVDEVTHRMLEGREVMCRRRDNTCDLE